MIKTLLSILIWPIALVSFVIGAFIYTIGLLILKPNKLHPLAKTISRIIMFASAQWFSVKGQLPEEKNGPYLYLINHSSLFDAFMIIGAVSHYCTGVGAKFQFSYPIWGYLAKRYGVIPIERTKIKSAIGSLNKLELAIKNGTSAMISPEGTRSLDGKLGKFKKGAFHVAKNTGVTIIPVGLLGAYNAKNINDWRISPGSLITVFGDPIYKSEYETLDVAELSSVVQTKISELIDN